jgi:hypothetical protein
MVEIPVVDLCQSKQKLAIYAWLAWLQRARYQQSAAARYSVVILFGKWFLGFATQKGIGDGVAQELGRSGYDFFVSCDSKIGIGELQIGLVECRFVDQLRNGAAFFCSLQETTGIVETIRHLRPSSLFNRWRHAYRFRF